ncbi:MAG: sodium:proton antiporter [Alphaproteobacteria bacterium]
MIGYKMLPYLMALVLLGVGIYAISCKKNLIKVIVGVIVIDYAVNLFLVLQGYRANGSAPILERGQTASAFAEASVDPLPQALVLTSIVIGLGVLALMVAIALRIHEKYGTFDLSEIRKLRG